MTSCSPKCDINASSTMMPTAININTMPSKLCIPKPKIRIKTLEELKVPSMSKLAKGMQVNSLKNVSSDNQVNLSVIGQSQPSDSKSYSHTLKFINKERLLKERLKKIEEKKLKLIPDLRKKKKSTLSSNKTCSFNDLDCEPYVIMESQHSEMRMVSQHSEMKKMKDKFRSGSPEENINLSNSRKECDDSNDADFLRNSQKNPNQEVKHCFEFVDVSENSFVELETYLGESVSTSSARNIHNMTDEKCYRDYKIKKVTDSSLNMNQPEVPSDEICEEVDSTELRDGIIKASRTLINTQKALKILINTISRDKSLPSQQAIRLIRRFQNVLKLCNRSLDEINLFIKNVYKYLFSEFDFQPLLDNPNATEVLGSGERDGEMILRDENSRNNNNKNLFVCKSKLKAEFIEENIF